MKPLITKPGFVWMFDTLKTETALLLFDGRPVGLVCGSDADGYGWQSGEILKDTFANESHIITRELAMERCKLYVQSLIDQELL